MDSPIARSRRPVAIAASFVLILGSITGVVTSAADAAVAGCAGLTTPVYQRVNPSTHAVFFSTSKDAAAKKASEGFTDDRGAVFLAATAPVSGVDQVFPVTQLNRKGDYFYTANSGEASSAQSKYKYATQGSAFAAVGAHSSAASSYDCLVPVYRYLQGSKHIYTLSKAEADKAVKAGAKSEKIAFYVAPLAGGSTPGPTPTDPPSGSSEPFTIAVFPDTQQEVLNTKDTRYAGRATYLLDQRDKLNLKFVSTVGDNVNWDTADHSQYEILSKGLKPLEKAGLRYSLTNGNHDNEATGVGGSARDAKRTRALVRDTSTFNSYFDAARFGAVAGAYERNKVDNVYSTFDAGGRHWMVLTLEIWPRLDAVAWAQQVIASHRNYNVIISTHSYLSSDGSIMGCTYTRCQYGDASPQYLFDNLVAKYPNVKIMLSGHVGTTAMRTDTNGGGKVASYLTCIHSNATNPIRFLTIDPKAGTIKTWVYGPYKDTTFPSASGTLTGMSFVNP